MESQRSVPNYVYISLKYASSMLSMWRDLEPFSLCQPQNQPARKSNQAYIAYIGDNHTIGHSLKFRRSSCTTESIETNTESQVKMGKQRSILQKKEQDKTCVIVWTCLSSSFWNSLCFLNWEVYVLSQVREVLS